MKTIFKKLLFSFLIFSQLKSNIIASKTEISTQKTETTRELDPTYILGALSGALNAVSERKQEKHPGKIHPISVIATILDQTAKLVHQEVTESERKQPQRSFTSEEITRPLIDFLSILDTEYKKSKTMKKITKHALLLQSYFEKSEDEKKEYLVGLHTNLTAQKKMLGEILFAAGNFIAEKTQVTADECTKGLLDVVLTKKAIYVEPVITKEIVSSEAQLLDMVGLLLAEKNETYKGELAEVGIVDHLTEITALVKEILSKDPNLLHFWKETPMIGALIKADSDFDRRALIAQYLENNDMATGFVQELVYCIYHIVFDRLGQMLTIAYHIVQIPSSSNDFDEDLYDDFSDDEEESCDHENYTEVLFEGSEVNLDVDADDESADDADLLFA